MIFDLLASEYGYSVEEISSLSMREVDMLLTACSKRTRQKLNHEASLHGMKLTGGEEPQEPIELPPEAEKNLDKLYQNAFIHKKAKLSG